MRTRIVDTVVGPRGCAQSAREAATSSRTHLIIDGRLAGSWTRTHGRDAARVDVVSYRRLTPADRRAVAAAAERYGRFMEQRWYASRAPRDSGCRRLVACSWPPSDPGSRSLRRRPSAPSRRARQLAWHDLEFYGFIHFSVNTFTDKEWGYGDEAASVFNPTALDARQWARVARDAGMKGLIITAKHHDGFALWPSRFTEHSVKGSPWKNGKGDVVGDLARACREYGLAFGVYLSPWDRNHADYGRPAYLEYYRNQLRELLTNYGPIAEVWFDGANGGDGYYGGARERRRIDGVDVLRLGQHVEARARAPAEGRDVQRRRARRALGRQREGGRLRDVVEPDHARRVLSRASEIHADRGREARTAPTGFRPRWTSRSVPAGSITRPKTSKVASVDKLIEIYEQSIGRGSNLLLNIPPDRRGLIPDIDAERLREFGQRIAATYKTDLARQATVRASQVRGGSPRFAAARVNDGDSATYWATDDGVASGTLDARVAPARSGSIGW